MPGLIDLTGQRFGRLTVIERATNSKRGEGRWLCRCDCGKAKVVLSWNLQCGDVQSCGCWNRERQTKHGLSRTRLYSIWSGMIHRCTDEKHMYYNCYGGRGIKVCDEWLNNVTAFYNWAIENGYSDDLTIDRIDPNGDYEPSNCRWATTKEQGINRRDTIEIEINGERKTVREWAEISGVKYITLLHRYHNGKRGEELLRKPHGKTKG